jgi:hypothetical protein
MGVIKVKTFIHALNIIHRNVRESKKYLSDKRLTTSEKKILSCWLLLRENKFSEIIGILDSIQTNPSAIVNSQKKLIWGITLNNKAEFSAAVKLLNEAQREIIAFDLPNQHYIAAYNLFITYFNLKDLSGMARSLTLLSQITPVNERQQICLLQCHFNYHSFLGELKEANGYLVVIESLREHMSESVIMTHLLSKFIYMVKMENWYECQNTLNEMKKFRSFNSSSNFTYMKLLLDHFLHNSPLYVYKNKFEHYPMLYSQLKVIQCLEESDQEGARIYWKELQMGHPEIYLENYLYKGDKSIFSLCLAKHLKAPVIKKQEIPISSSKENALISILQNASAPIRKELLYELIWQETLEDKTDLLKLKKMISRSRERGLDIQYKKGCYILVKPVKERAA